MNRAEILDTAKDAVTGQRAEDHGEVEDNFANVAALWSGYRGSHFTVHDVAMMMILFKVARSKGNQGHADNYIDIAGYAACAGEIAT